MTGFWSDPFWDGFFWSDVNNNKEEENSHPMVTNIADNWYTPAEDFKRLAPVFADVPKVKYIHLWVNPEYGRVTVAYYVQDGLMYMGFSFCQPKERFCKRDGRERALARLMEKPVTHATLPSLFDDFSVINTLISFFHNVHEAYGRMDIEKLLHVAAYDGKNLRNKNFSFWMDSWIILWLLKNGSVAY